MFNGLRKLYDSDFDRMSQEWQPDGSVIITLSRRGENQSFRMHIADLYGENEEVLSHEVIPTNRPWWITDRMKEAKKHGSESSAGPE